MNILSKATIKKVSIIVPIVLVVIFVGYELLIPSSDEAVAAPASITAHNGSSIAADSTVHEYLFTDAPKHIGERAAISGTVFKVFTSKSGVTFLDFCKSGTSCPFVAVIFASDAKNFPDLTKYQRAVKITGVIKSYQSKAEIVVSDPEQIE